ncbi:hypothetical protein [Plesiomonas sp. ZOR0011]|uniref:hypothetical protein n=1 Tax=Plesiomonas sp. ZOR0011 TaxID=1339230 RepID=UPI00068C74F1|nr:hypothetical protein [Plesiomonas sp. ZOR0011]
MALNKKSPLVLSKRDGEREQDAVARSAAGQVNAAASANILAGRLFGEGMVDLPASVRAIEALCNQVAAGNLTPLEKMLTSQALVLDQLFGDLTRRALGAPHQRGREVDLKLALKAQAQCRATAEALAEIKLPKPKIFAKQANVAHMQQVNNAAPPARGRKSGKRKIELMEGSINEQWLDTSTQGKTGRDDPSMATVDATKHGQYTQAAKGERAELRELLRRMASLLRED